MADKPQAIAVNTKSNETAGPPLAAALPIVLKIPAPIIAATPKAVRSKTRRVRFIPPMLPANESASVKICEMDFFRKRFSNFTVPNVLGKNKEKSICDVLHVRHLSQTLYFRN